jgi:hypothetical protein
MDIKWYGDDLLDPTDPNNPWQTTLSDSERMTIENKKLEEYNTLEIKSDQSNEDKSNLFESIITKVKLCNDFFIKRAN